jgi:hypothetical protein
MIAGNSTARHSNATAACGWPSVICFEQGRKNVKAGRNNELITK